MENNKSENNKPKFFNKKLLPVSFALFFAIALSILFFFIVYNAKDVNLGLGKLISAIKPFIYGAVFAYLLVPMCNYFERHLNRLFINRFGMEKSKSANICQIISIFLSLCLGLFVIYILLSLVLPQLIVSLTTITRNFDTYYIKVSSWVQNLFKNNEFLRNYFETISDNVTDVASQWIKNELLPSTTTLISNLSGGLLGAFSIIKNIFIGLIVAIYFLRSRASFAAQSRIFVHCIFRQKLADRIIEEVKFANKMFMGFISGRLVDSTIIGLLCFIGISIMGMPYPLLVSVLVGVTNIIPFFGPFIGGIPAAFIILMASPAKCIWFIIFIVILQQIDGNIIGPKILGEMTNLSSFWVLFSIMLFSGLFGFVGMIIGVPVFAVIYHMAQELIMKGMKRTGYVPTPEDAEVSKLNAYLAAKESPPPPKEEHKKKILQFKNPLTDIKDKNKNKNTK